jgi:pimeloyl-ACP methyl ester carboxylesterase
MLSQIPETRYARSGDLSIAYQVLGEGPPDILFIPGFVSNVELMWDVPFLAHYLERLARMGRLVFFDKRGTGLSDRSLGSGSAADRMDDLRAVADAAGIEAATVIGLSEGGPLGILFATTYPERVPSLVLWAPSPGSSRHRTTRSASRPSLPAHGSTVCSRSGVRARRGGRSLRISPRTTRRAG